MEVATADSHCGTSRRGSRRAKVDSMEVQIASVGSSSSLVLAAASANVTAAASAAASTNVTAAASAAASASDSGGSASTASTNTNSCGGSASTISTISTISASEEASCIVGRSRRLRKSNRLTRGIHMVPCMRINSELT